MLPVLIALVFASSQPAVSKDASDVKELHRLEAVWNDAHVKGDADALDKLWANDLLVTIAAMPSSPNTNPCSTVSAPASAAMMTPSSPMAWTVAGFFQRWASSMAARSSSGEQMV